jgi:hypothetical protein
MGFECPNQLNGYCRLNKSDCTPTKRKCVLRGRFRLLDEEDEGQLRNDK